jgi:hypothetical protein
MLKGLAITPPAIGRISIGRVVEKNGKRLPEKDDQFTITTQVQNHEGWILHPLDEALRKATGDKLRSIPVRVLFNNPDLNLRAEYSSFDRETGRPLCVGNGENCRRVTGDGIEAMPCPSPDGCDFGQKSGCKPYGRLHVIVGEDELGTFVFRTTSFNSIRTLTARLRYFHAVSGGMLATMPLELRLRGKSTTQSYRRPIYYVDLAVPPGKGLDEAVIEARDVARHRQEAGIDQAALDQAAREGFANGAFEELAEDGQAVAEEFYPAEGGEGTRSDEPSGNISLRDKLTLKAASKQEGSQ